MSNTAVIASGEITLTDAFTQDLGPFVRQPNQRIWAAIFVTDPGSTELKYINSQNLVSGVLFTLTFNDATNFILQLASETGGNKTVQWSVIGKAP